MTNPSPAPERDPSPVANTAARVNSDFRWYLAGVASWFIGLAIQFALFPGLVALVLRASPDRVGIAQMAILLPMLFFLLPAGALADRVDPRRIIIAVQAIAVAPPLLLAWVVHQGQLSYGLLIVFALIMGSTSAVISPAREGLLPRVARGNLQEAVTAATGLQFAVQFIGFLIVYLLADRFGPVPVLIAQGAAYGLGVAAFVRLRTRVEPPAHARTPALHMIADGFRVLFASAALRAVSLLNVALGVFYMGVFLVGIPLVVRDVYQGTQADIALTSMASISGTIVATTLLLRSGGVVRKGRALLLSLLVSAGSIAAMSLAMPFSAMLAAIALSGAAGGTGMIMGRTLVQEAAPDTHRARVMAIYTLTALGGAPLGSLFVGYLAANLGVSEAMLCAATAILAIVTATWVGTRLRTF